ncbi:MAG: Adenylosuccinate lyase [Candidatus Curtissbacteria bacterium GW2011_GWA1_41_11]|uniref:Adenylosuccinate lyase n=1 Tax=Candidatus Curtissbacteria bacterium GW2011_GWA1_41_11 TaxID=1618409 RepID=A0A0G0XJ77_9BACT|nr:MAG: Adenylosuccinate lyase [Candidatus Curtissbacteria bacterium GW2011_GWA1_41_11]
MVEQGTNALPLTELTAVTTLDGRYREKTAELATFVSEFSLIRTRFEIEARYLLALSDARLIRKLTGTEKERLESFSTEIGLKEARSVKRIEKRIRHDVKSTERSFRDLVIGTSLEDLTEIIHFGLTSEDVNNLAYRLMLERATSEICIPVLDSLVDDLVDRADTYKEIPMLARTHGQAAVPTTVGKELIVFATRLNKEVRKLDGQELTGKLTGAVGNLNSLVFVYPKFDWQGFSQKFVESFGFVVNMTTTQINSYEDVIEYFQTYQRINGILEDFAQDMWRYISDDWFVQEVKEGEVGSSTMTQKVNPIDFENAEGNLPLANGIFEVLSRKLAVSRLQRHLSDSTMIRNLGTALGYSLVAYKGLLDGIKRIRPNETKIEEDLNKDWSILGEAVQTLLRKTGVKDPFKLVAALTRGKHIDHEGWLELVDKLPVDKDQKAALRELTPQTYTGLAEDIVEKAIIDIKSSRKDKNEKATG